MVVGVAAAGVVRRGGVLLIRNSRWWWRNTPPSLAEVIRGSVRCVSSSSGESIADVVRRHLGSPTERRILLDKLGELSPAVGVLRDEADQLNKLKSESSSVDAADELRLLVDEDLVRVESELESVVVGALLEAESGEAAAEVVLGSNEVMFEVSAGVGGQEAMLFAQELHQMYLAWFQFNGWDADVLNQDYSELGGLRHSSVEVRSSSSPHPTYLSYILCVEGGVHRVQRVPRTEKAGRVHTSTASVAVIPLSSSRDSDTLKIPDSDLRVDTKRASGAGGQHVNTTESAVRITHLPSGVVVECQSQRSQIQNRSEAMRVLRRRLAALEAERSSEEMKRVKEGQVGKAERNEKIRTYNYNQDRVTDHREGGVTSYDLKGVLQGQEQLHKFNQSVRDGIRVSRVNRLIHQWIKDNDKNKKKSSKQSGGVG